MMEEKIIFESIVGSHAYGTNIKTSDTDIKGIYQQPNTDILGFNYRDQIELDKDTTYYEIKRFIELAGSANPTILEMLFVDDKFVKINTPQFQILRDNRHLFLTKECGRTFGGYAMQQIKKAKGLNKKMNWEKEKTVRKNPIDFCFVEHLGKSINIVKWLEQNEMRQEFVGLSSLDKMANCYAVFYDWASDYNYRDSILVNSLGYRGIAFENSNDIRLSSIPKNEVCEQVLYYNKDAYSIHCKEYNEYQNWLASRNVARYVDTVKANLDIEQKIDSKNLMHCMRLIHCGMEIANTGDFTVLRPEADYLLAIRFGEIALEDIIEQAEKNIADMDLLFKESTLPDKFDMKTGHELLLKIRQL